MCQHCLEALDHESLYAFLWHHWAMLLFAWWIFIVCPAITIASGK